MLKRLAIGMLLLLLGAVSVCVTIPEELIANTRPVKEASFSAYKYHKLGKTAEDNLAAQRYSYKVRFMGSEVCFMPFLQLPASPHIMLQARHACMLHATFTFTDRDRGHSLRGPPVHIV